MSDNSLLLKDLGYRLKREREQKGFSIDQVIQLTRISRTNITAIEEGNLEELPHTVYAKGFIRSYAEFLGVPTKEVDEILEQVIDKDSERNTYSNAVRKAPTGAPIRGADTIRENTKKSSFPTILLILVLVGVLAGLVWYIQGNSNLFTPAQKEKAVEIMEEDAAVPPDMGVADERFEQEQKDEAVMDADTPGTVSDPVAESDTEEKTETDAATVDAAEESAAEQTDAEAAAEETPSATADSAEEASSGQAAAVEEKPAAQAPNTQVQDSRADTDQAETSRSYKKNSVIVTAKKSDSCWMEVRADGGTIKEYFIQRGQAARFAYNQSLWIRLGNAGGVTMSHNGKSYPLDSHKGQVKTLIFP